MPDKQATAPGAPVRALPSGLRPLKAGEERTRAIGRKGAEVTNKLMRERREALSMGQRAYRQALSVLIGRLTYWATKLKANPEDQEAQGWVVRVADVLAKHGKAVLPLIIEVSGAVEHRHSVPIVEDRAVLEALKASLSGDVIDAQFQEAPQKAEGEDARNQ